MQAGAESGGGAPPWSAGQKVWWTRPAVYFTAGLGLSVFAGVWGDMGLGGLPIKPDRILLLVGIVLAVWTRRRHAGRARLRFTGTHLAMILAVGYVVVSGLPVHTITTKDGIFQLLDRFGIVPYLMYSLAPLFYERESDRNILLIGLTITGAYLGLTALFETLKLNALILPHFISNPNVGIHFDRARGPFLDASGNGLAMFACGAAALYAAVKWRGAARCAAGVVAALSVLGIFFTVTRANWVGASAGAAVALLAFRETRRLVLPAAIVGVVLLWGSLTFIPSLSGKVSTRTHDQSTVWDRENTDTTALRMLEMRPLFGWGWDTFLQKSVPYYRQAATYPITGIGKGVHNVILGNAVDLGLVGVTLWLVALVLGVGGAILRRGPPELRPWRMMATAYAVCWLVAGLFNPVPFAMTNSMVWIFAGVASIAWLQEPRLAAVRRVRPAPAGMPPGPVTPTGEVAGV